MLKTRERTAGRRVEERMVRTFLNSIRPLKLARTWPRSFAAINRRFKISSTRAAAADAAAFELMVETSWVMAKTL
jgi:hypothetical protein